MRKILILNITIIKIIIISFAVYSVGISPIAEAVNKDKCVTSLYLACNLARRDPVENILFAYAGDGLYEFFKLDGTAQNRQAVIYHAPFDIPIAAYTLYKFSAKELVKELEFFDYMKDFNYRYPYVVPKPLIILSLRTKEAEPLMRFYRILPSENDEWKEYLPAFMAVATASGDTLTFDWRPVYQVAFSKESASSPIFQAMENNEEPEEQIFENVKRYNDTDRMNSKYLNVEYLETLLKDWYKEHPQITPLNFQEEYQKILKNEEYMKTLNDINALVAKNLD